MPPSAAGATARHFELVMVVRRLKPAAVIECLDCGGALTSGDGQGVPLHRLFEPMAKSMEPLPDLLTVQETARLLKVSVSSGANAGRCGSRGGVRTCCGKTEASDAFCAVILPSIRSHRPPLSRLAAATSPTR